MTSVFRAVDSDPSSPVPLNSASSMTCLKSPRNFRVSPHPEEQSISPSSFSSVKRNNTSRSSSRSRVSIISNSSCSSGVKRFRNKVASVPGLDNNLTLDFNRSCSSIRNRSGGTDNINNSNDTNIIIVDNCDQNGNYLGQNGRGNGGNDTGSGVNNGGGGTGSGFRRFLLVTTIIYLSLINLIPLDASFPCLVNGEILSETSKTRDFTIKSIWEELTDDEIQSIFGSSHARRFNSVPTFDVIEPKITHRKARGKRSFGEDKRERKLIQIEGLGRSFNLTIRQNRNLLDPHFVFLKRHDNQSEIMPETHVKGQLHCFYQGEAKHSKVGTGNNIVSAPVALSLCGGLKGFILSSSDRDSGDHHHHYVIHPVPDRLHNKPKLDEHSMQHFLFKRQNKLSSLVHSKHAKSSFTNINNNADDGTCVHNHNEQNHNNDHQKDRSFTNVIMNENELRLKTRTSPPLQLKSTNYGDNKGVNRVQKTQFNIRNKRSSEDFFQNYQHQHTSAYPLPLNIAPDSYWLQYRSNLFSSPARPTTSTAAFPSSFWRQKSGEITSSYGGMGIRGINQRSYDTRDDEYDTSATNSDNNMSWSKGVLVYESASSVEEPDTILPFFTKGRKRSSKIKSSWPSENLQHKSYSSSSEIGKDNKGTHNYTEKFFRKGRRDDTHFGQDWKSPLDSPDTLMFPDKGKNIQKQSRYDEDSNSIYSREKPPAQLTIETAVFVDKDLYKHMQSNFPDDTHGQVVQIVLAMINAVQLLYHDPSLGHRVDFVLKRLEVLETDPPGLLRPYDIDRFLTNFCKWQKTENPTSDADPLHWDHALILTGLDLYVVHQSGKISNQVVGLAPVAGMCTRSSSCTVNEGRHFESVFVISHEIGHNLGMRHDGPQADNDCDPTSHIMSPTLGSGKITWSPCSKKYLDMFLETSQSKCLLDKAKSEVRLDHDADGRLPGERFDADRQCVLKYGRGSFHATQQPLEDVCRDLHCRREHYTWTSHPALEGTYCGTDMLCRAGKCLRRTDSYTSPSSYDPNADFIGSNRLPGETAAYTIQKAVDGVWGKWSLFTDCSSACLYSNDGRLPIGSTGVRLAARRCDSPRPENGGRQCSGPDRRYKTCQSNKICSGNLDRTTITQYANEVCNRAATVDTELTGVGFMMSTNDAERACSVWCETLESGVPRSRGWSFPDGTTCKVISQSESQSYCVAGKCQDFSCNPYSHYALSDDECSFSGSNEVTPQSSWYGGVGSKVNQRSGKAGWTDWETQSECKLPCLAPAKGLELVKRLCSSGDSLCSGLAISVRLCKPDKTTIIRNRCTRLQTPFEYATKVCSKYAEKITGLSGIGMQLSPTKDDIDRPCRIGCQDASIPYRFYMVNGEDGWFPPGTDCSRGDPDKKAYCLAGKCIDFGHDDTPVYRVNSKIMGRIESIFQRTKRQTSYNIMEPLNVPDSLDQSSLRDLVHKFSQQTGNFPSIASRRSDSNTKNPVDFSRPVVIPVPTDYPPITRGSHSSYSPYYNNLPVNSYSSMGANNNARSDDTYYSNSNNYRPDTRNNFKHQSGRGRSLSLDYVDVDTDIFPAPGSGRMISGSSGHDYKSNHWGNLPSPVEGSFYEWRKIVSDCSVSCNAGIQEIIVECISGETKVSDHFCEGRPRPGHSGYVKCSRPACIFGDRDDREPQSSHIWNWLQSILPKNSSYSDNVNLPYDNAYYDRH